ncbi:MAG: hypothetical protein IIT63_04565 [Prevotella sp.]|jgi:plastocyanin|nr:hypothetical protein [Prevotella sp.]MBQ5455082.1 hypothetical protein [Prevotella sp.]
MKKSRFIIYLMLGALCLASWSCTRHDDDDDDDYSSNHTSVTSLSGTTWTYGENSHTAIIDFSQTTFVMTFDDGDTERGTYNYDGESFTCSFYDEEGTYKVYCITKANTLSSLQGTVWKFEENYNGRIYTSTIYLYENTFTLIEDGYGDEERGTYSYDGNTITATCDGDTYYLKCGRVLYEMARNNTGIW